MKVILIRHTRVDVPKGTCYGWTDVPLADTFLKEAAITENNLEQIDERRRN
jgi:alpha-ribazole phosphatase